MRYGSNSTTSELPLAGNGAQRAEDTAGKLAELKAADVNVVYLGSSSSLRKNGDAFNSAAVEANLLVLSPYEQFARESHALMSVAARFFEVVRLAGHQAEKIPMAEVPGDLPVARMKNFAVINLDVARKLQFLPTHRPAPGGRDGELTR